jgi:hypothetical protein
VPLTLVSTNNGGVGPPGLIVKAINVATGSTVWTFEGDYPVARSSSNPNVPVSGIPAGASGVSLPGTSVTTHVVATSLYGDVWLLKVGDGTSAYVGTDTFPKPLFRFSSDFKPIGASAAIYERSGVLHALVGSGGYVDPLNTSWIDDSEQFAIGVSLETPANLTPVTDAAGSDFGGNRHIRLPLGFDDDGRPNRVFSQATVIGGEIYLVTDSGDVNLETFGTPGGTGRVYRLSISAGSQVGSAVTIAGGAGGVDATADGIVFTGGGDSVSKTVVAGFDADGSSEDHAGTTHVIRNMLWLELQ